MEETCHRLFLIIVKYLPFIIAIVYFIASVVSCFGIIPTIVPNIFYMSPVTMLFMLSASFAFKFCIWHRLPIYYAGTLHLISIIDYYTKIPITSYWLLFIYLTLTILVICIGMILKNKSRTLK